MRRKIPRVPPRRALVALLALGLAVVVLRAPWSDGPRAEPERVAISRRGVLGGADYLIEVPANWRGGLVVFAHGIQRGPGPGAVASPPIGLHIVVASLELPPGLYQGGLAECGLVDGISIADYLMAYTAAAELIAGVPLLDAPDKEAFARVLNERVVPALGMPGSYTARGRQFDSVVKYLMGADEAGNDLPLRLRGLERHTS